MTENQLDLIPSNGTRYILNHIACNQFCILDRKDGKQRKQFLNNTRISVTGNFILISVVVTTFKCQSVSTQVKDQCG